MEHEYWKCVFLIERSFGYIFEKYIQQKGVGFDYFLEKKGTNFIINKYCTCRLSWTKKFRRENMPFHYFNQLFKNSDK